MCVSQQHLLPVVVMFLTLWLESIQGQSITFGGPSSGNNIRPPPPSTQRPMSTSRPIMGKGPVAPGPVGPVGSTPKIGFSVRKAAGSDPSTFLLQASNIPISFQEVLSNVGSGWTGLIFQAPVAGHYFFTFHAQTSEMGEFTMSLRKNGQYQVTAYGGKSGYQWGSNSALLNLHAGDTVYLKLDEGEIYEHPFDEAYTTFTGFLVFQ